LPPLKHVVEPRQGASFTHQDQQRTGNLVTQVSFVVFEVYGGSGAVVLTAPVNCGGIEERSQILSKHFLADGARREPHLEREWR